LSGGIECDTLNANHDRQNRINAVWPRLLGAGLLLFALIASFDQGRYDSPQTILVTNELTQLPK
jgi:hypothetical protein